MGRGLIIKVAGEELKGRRSRETPTHAGARVFEVYMYGWAVKGQLGGGEGVAFGWSWTSGGEVGVVGVRPDVGDEVRV